MLNRLLDKFGYILYNKKFHETKYILKSEFRPLEQLFYKNLHPDFFFIQIGANDGKSYDPIYHLVTKENVAGIALEPLPDIFLKLKENYKNYSNVKLVNKAIHNSLKEVEIFRVDNSSNKYPEWTKGTASFRKEHHIENGIDSNDIISKMVECISLDKLVEKFDISNIDLLQIDTEGYDYDIISNIDFSKIKPHIISFEHGMSSSIMSVEKFYQIFNKLMKNGYKIITLSYDAIAYLD